MFPAHRHLLLDDGFAYVNGSFTDATDSTYAPNDAALDTEGNLFFIDNLSVKKITPSREVSTVISNLSTPIQCIVAKNGIMFVVDRIMKGLYSLCTSENTNDWNVMRPEVYIIKRYIGNSAETLTFGWTRLNEVPFFDNEEEFWFTYWQHVPHISLCPDGRLLIYSNDSLEATHATCMEGNMLPLCIVNTQECIGGPIDDSSLQKICTNSKGVIYILNFSGALYRRHFLVNELRLLVATSVLNMTMDNNDNLYFELDYKLYKMNTLSEKFMDIISREEHVVANWTSMRTLYSNLTSADETGLYYCWSCNIEKIYFDNVYWTQKLHSRLSPFLQEQIETVLKLGLRGHNNYSNQTLFSRIPMEILLEICHCICTIRSEDIIKKRKAIEPLPEDSCSDEE